jgi:hypothetical protein
VKLPGWMAGFPPEHAVVNGLPRTKLLGQIPPGEACAGAIQCGFDILTVTVTQLQRTPGFVWQGSENRCRCTPSIVCQEPETGLSMSHHVVVIAASVCRSRSNSAITDSS